MVDLLEPDGARLCHSQIAHKLFFNGIFNDRKNKGFENSCCHGAPVSCRPWQFPHQWLRLCSLFQWHDVTWRDVMWRDVTWCAVYPLHSWNTAGASLPFLFPCCPLFQGWCVLWCGFKNINFKKNSVNSKCVYALVGHTCLKMSSTITLIPALC